MKSGEKKLKLFWTLSQHQHEVEMNVSEQNRSLTKAEVCVKIRNQTIHNHAKKIFFHKAAKTLNPISPENFSTYEKYLVTCLHVFTSPYQITHPLEHVFRLMMSYTSYPLTTVLS